MEQQKTRIGIFDSGIGGFSILNEIMGKAHSVEIDYISDDAFAPYGEKSDSEIVKRSKTISEILLYRECSLIVVACNSATAAAIAELRQEHQNIPFVGVEPYINVLNHKNHFPGIRKAAVITTELTGNSKKFRILKEKIDPTNRVIHLSMPNLASIVESILENGLTPSMKANLTTELQPLRGLNLSHLILGCTHYPLIAALIEEALDVVTVSPGKYVANRVFDLIPISDGDSCTAFSYMSTSSMNWQHRTRKYLSSLLKYSLFSGEQSDIS